MANLKNTIINDSGFLKVPVGTQSQRSIPFVDGGLRFDSSTNQMENYASSKWTRIGAQRSETYVRDGLIMHLDAANADSYPGSGNTWFDLTDNNYDATLQNSPVRTGETTPYFSFDGVNQKTDQSIPNINLSADSMTIELWFRANELPTGYIDDDDAFNAALYGNRFGSDIQTFIYPATNGESNLGVCYDDSRGTSAHRSNRTIQANEWVQFVWVARPSYQILYYINGKLDKGPFNSSDSSLGVPTTWSIARDNRYGGYSNIDMSIVRRYDRELSAEEINQNFRANRWRFRI